VLLVHGKGRDEKDNFVLLTEKTYQPIAEYLATRGKVTAQSLYLPLPLITAKERDYLPGV
jgi:hypothetical protein